MRNHLRALRLVVLSILFVAALAGVLLSPLGLRLLDTDGVNWGRASDIGQTYGAISAVLSAMALGGIGLSVILQVRANNQARIQATRQMHTDLIKLALEDPLYLPCWGAPHAGSIDERQTLYINLILSYWQARWDIDLYSESMVRALAADFFRGEAPRLYWQEYGAARLSHTPQRRRRDMVKILDDEYRKAIAAGSPTRPATASIAPQAEPRIINARTGTLVVTGLAMVGAAAIVLERAWRQLASKR